ncbi:hypothetical protein DEO72_LG6g671 [Vigna unguiculata]|uniref:TF-B3 domain-containing protein n=1 Tax=Vigna unguiculata TaxID=3917 RepID=A0A4D6M5D6_VIGUN|nr:hypothetical protein DEO72_LG6g671 [Vigna unguiculata]
MKCWSKRAEKRFIKCIVRFLERRTKENPSKSIGFFLEWGKSLVIGTNYFSDPSGNVLNIKYFRLRVFDSYWKEVEYPVVGQSRTGMTYDPLGSPRFFQCFRVKLLRSTDELKLDRKVELYDPLRKKFELSVDTTDVGTIVLFGLAEFLKDSVSGNDIEHDVVNEPDGSGIPDNADVSAIVDNASPISDDGVVEYLTHYDVRSSCLYLNSNFAGQFLDKSRKSYLLINETAIYWPCSIRWTGRSNFECYLTCGWKTFCKDNGLAAGDGIKFVIDDDKKNIIHVVKV